MVARVAISWLSRGREISGSVSWERKRERERDRARVSENLSSPLLSFSLGLPRAQQKIVALLNISLQNRTEQNCGVLPRSASLRVYIAAGSAPFFFFILLFFVFFFFLLLFFFFVRLLPYRALLYFPPFSPLPRISCIPPWAMSLSPPPPPHPPGRSPRPPQFYVHLHHLLRSPPRLPSFFTSQPPS